MHEGLQKSCGFLFPPFRSMCPPNSSETLKMDGERAPHSSAAGSFRPTSFPGSPLGGNFTFGRSHEAFQRSRAQVLPMLSCSPHPSRLCHQICRSEPPVVDLDLYADTEDGPPLTAGPCISPSAPLRSRGRRAIESAEDTRDLPEVRGAENYRRGFPWMSRVGRKQARKMKRVR